MKNLIITLGITGCGKSSWLKNKHPVVETDDLRIELLGNIDDITQEGFIFKTACKRLAELLNSYDTVYFGATMVDSDHRISFLQSIKDMCVYSFVIDVVVFPSDPKVSIARIKKDLKDGIFRANSIQYIDQQYKQFLHTLDILSNERTFYRKIKYNLLP